MGLIAARPGVAQQNAAQHRLVC